MTAPNPEFSRLVSVARLGSAPLRFEIEATDQERDRLAQRFDLLRLDRLTAVVSLRRLDRERIELDAAFEAEFAQSCVVTLDPVPGRVAETFTLLYGKLGDEQADCDIDAEAPAFEPLTGDAIDIGEAVAQELSLALPEFPRLPDAVVESVDFADADPSPFAALEELRRPRQD
jgi:uncharacterized metal-binding protein YceD (DUF177 family)